MLPVNELVTLREVVWFGLERISQVGTQSTVGSDIDLHHVNTPNGNVDDVTQTNKLSLAALLYSTRLGTARYAMLTFTFGIR